MIEDNNIVKIGDKKIENLICDYPTKINCLHGYNAGIKYIIPKNIKYMFISNNNLTYIPKGIIEVLYIKKNKLSGLIFIDSEYLLKHIDASYNNINNFITYSSKFIKIELKNNFLTDINIQYSYLNYLDISNNLLNNKLIKNMEKWNCINTLTYLNMSSNNLEGFIDLTKFNSLITLNLSNNKITELILPDSIVNLYVSSNKLTKLIIKGINKNNIYCSSNFIKNIYIETNINYLISNDNSNNFNIRIKNPYSIKKIEDLKYSY